MRTEKLQIVKDIGVILKESDFVFLISYKGLKVSEFSDLRNKLSEQKKWYRSHQNLHVRVHTCWRNGETSWVNAKAFILRERFWGK